MTDVLLWAGLALLIALMALAVFAGRKGLRSLGVVGPNADQKKLVARLDRLTDELSKLNDNLERLILHSDGRRPSDQHPDDQR